MANRIAKPTNPYDPLWVQYAQENPGLRRSLSSADVADDDAGGGDDGAADDVTPDYTSHLPEQFNTDGKADFEGFRASYDELSSFKSQADEAASALPEDPSGYAFTLPEGHVLPEGFDVEALKTVDDEGNEIEFDPANMIKADDPDVLALQTILHEQKVSPEVMGKLAGLMVNRELRQLTGAVEVAKEEKAKLGPDNGKARISTITRVLESRLPKEQVKALLDGATTADGIRGLETLVKKANIQPSSLPGGKVDHSELKPLDRVLLGNKSRTRA